jgi:hypothetical protein
MKLTSVKTVMELAESGWLPYFEEADELLFRWPDIERFLMATEGIPYSAAMRRIAEAVWPVDHNTGARGDE